MFLLFSVEDLYEIGSHSAGLAWMQLVLASPARISLGHQQRDERLGICQRVMLPVTGITAEDHWKEL